MYRKIIGIIDTYKGFGIRSQLVVILNFMVCVLSLASFTGLYLLGEKGLASYYWILAFFFAAIVVERALRPAWQKTIIITSVYIYALLIIPVGFILMGSVTMPMVLYCSLSYLSLNFVATNTQRKVINPFLVVFVFLYILFEYYHPNYLYQVPVGKELLKYYLVTVPICQIAFIAFGIAITKAYLTKHNMLLQKNNELESLMRIDPLTGLYNKQFLNEQIKVSMGMAKRLKVPMAVLVVDIDYFKKYNDMYGHIQGDKCLVKVASVLRRSALRTSDTVFRFGGEEFVLLLNNTGIDQAKGIAQRLKKNINTENIEHLGSVISDHITISVGISSYMGEEDMNSDTVIQRADSALYRAKELGRNRCVSINDSEFSDKNAVFDKGIFCKE